MTRATSRPLFSRRPSVALRCLRAAALVALVPQIACVEQAADPAAPDPITIQVVDERGQPFAAGTALTAVEWNFPDPAAPDLWIPSGMGPEEVRLEVGRDGAVRYAPKHPGWGLAWLRLERPTVAGRGERAFVPLRAMPERVALVPEQRLAAGALVDAAGTAVPSHAPMLGVVGDERSEVPVAQSMEPRWVLADGTYELWGWRVEGAFWLTATYDYLGPPAPRVPLPFGAADLTLTLPTTGYVQVELPTPKPFPEYGAVYAVLRDIDRGDVRRHYLIPNLATNLRTLVGRFAVTVELNGDVVRDFGTLTVTHNQTTGVRHDLRPTVRLFRIEVVNPDGTPEMPARVRVVGSTDEAMARQPVEFDDGRRHAFVVATTRERVDLEVSRHGGQQVVIVKGVDGDRRIELPAERR